MDQARNLCEHPTLHFWKLMGSPHVYEIHCSYLMSLHVLVHMLCACVYHNDTPLWWCKAMASQEMQYMFAGAVGIDFALICCAEIWHGNLISLVQLITFPAKESIFMAYGQIACRICLLSEPAAISLIFGFFKDRDIINEPVRFLCVI